MDFVEIIFLKILNMSITASYVILAVLLIRFCISKAPKIFSYIMWSVVAFRLLCPFSFSSLLSIFNFNLFDMTLAQGNSNRALTYVPTNIGSMETPKVTVGIPIANSFISETLPVAGREASVFLMQIVISVTTILWCIGIAVLLFLGIVSYIKMKRKVSGAILLEKNIYECDRIPSPFVLGFVKPKIYIPFRLNKQEREFILCHEQCHIKRFDYIIKPLSFLILTVYWFNPLVWIAYLSMCKDMEMSCDEKVLSNMGISIKKDYSMSLLSFSTKRRFPMAGPLAFGESGLKRRVKNILNFKKRKTWFTLVAVILSIGVIVACATNPSPEKISPDNFIEAQVVSLEDGNINAFELSDNPIDDNLVITFDENMIDLNIEALMEGTRIKVGYKNRTRRNILATSIELLPADITTNIFGYYEFDENIYTNPLSSFFPFKDNMPYYELTENSLKIYYKDDSIEEIAMAFDKEDFDKDAFEAYFERHIKIPDIAQYRECYQYGVSLEDTLNYRLYVMDDEVWLGYLANNGVMWSIYKLIKTDVIRTIEGVEEPTEMITNMEQYDLTDLEQALTHAILTENARDYLNGAFKSEAHTTLKTIESGNKVTVYAMVLYMEYSFDENGISGTPSGNHMPVAMTFERTAEDIYYLLEYWRPQDGTYYLPSIKKKFPKDIYNNAIDTQKYIEEHQIVCDEKAMEYFTKHYVD